MLRVLPLEMPNLRHIFSLSFGCLALCATSSYASDITLESLFAPEKTPSFAPAVRFFKQSGSVNQIERVTLSYFSDSDCSASIGTTYSTPNDESAIPFQLNGSAPFSLNSHSAYIVATNQSSIPTPETSVGSVLVKFSTLNDTYSANFAPTLAQCNNNGNCCVPISCSSTSETCINTLMPQQPFTFDNTPIVPPTVEVSFYPATFVDVNTPTPITLTLTNPNLLPATLSAPLVNNLPTNLFVATTPNASTTCTGGVVSASPSDVFFSLNHSAQIPPNSSCTVTVDVSSSIPEAYTNALGVGVLTTTNGSNTNSSSDNLVVGGVFPAPYCTIAIANGVEPITFVGLQDLSNVTSSVIGGTALENFLNISPTATITPSNQYALSLRGNTDGNFTNYFTVFFDWDHSGTFSSPGINIGSITNSAGSSPTISNLITIPGNATPGYTRMRVVKVYNPSIEYPEDPCATYGYGQAEDYLVLVSQP